MFASETDLTRSVPYFTGTTSVPITAARNGTTLTVTFDDLGLPGTLELQLAGAGAVSRNGTRLTEGTDYRFDRQARKLTVPFSGALALQVDDPVSLFVEPPPTPPADGCACRAGASGVDSGAGALLGALGVWLLALGRRRRPDA